jgi:pimeloyl-ACP methyl ester carboxylesterase
MRVKFTNVNGIETRYYHEGEGYPLLLVHGGGISADSWVRNIDALARDFRVLAPDLLGHGFTGSGRYAGGPPQPDMVDHLIAFANHMGLEKFAVAGSSYGAMLSMLMYFQMRERIERLIFFSSASTTLTDEERAKSLEQAYRNGSSAIQEPTLENVRRRLERIFHDPAKVPQELLLIQLNIYMRPAVQVFYDRMMRGMMDLGASRPWRVCDRFAEIHAPLLMLWGLSDKRVKYERAVEAARQAREAYLVGLENCGHEPYLEQPERSNELVRSFLLGESLAQYCVLHA